MGVLYVENVRRRFFGILSNSRAAIFDNGSRVIEAFANDRGNVVAAPITEKDHAIGPADAPITIVEYGDYECPDCFNAVPVIERVRESLGDKLRFVFRHFPQNSIHPHASAAAEAAEAAADQGKFWLMHEALFRHQKDLTEIDFSHLALTLGLDIYKFETSRNRELHVRRVRSDFESGLRSGVKGTPTLFINGRKYEGKMEAGEIVAAASSQA
jgi:protein-disulfide isomerase